ncbi:MAG: hypothetical protein OEN50_17685, partial [Deltaproteobacteria bacterium]|nr:hypothetical protein [Deltaproteobacteria bacterium]
FVLTARKLNNVTLRPQELGLNAILGFQEYVILDTQVKICNESSKILKSELKLVSGNSVALSALETRLIEAIDGKTRFGEIIVQLASMLGTEHLPDGELDKLKNMLAQLVELGALRFVHKGRMFPDAHPSSGSGD